MVRLESRFHWRGPHPGVNGYELFRSDDGSGTLATILPQLPPSSCLTFAAVRTLRSASDTALTPEEWEKEAKHSLQALGYVHAPYGRHMGAHTPCMRQACTRQ